MAKPKYTEEQQLPGAFEGETVTRRRLMTASVHGFGAIAAAAFTLPALGFAIAPVFEEEPDTWQEVGPLSRFTNSNYTPEVMTIQPGVGEAGLSIVYVRIHNLAIDGPIKDKYDRVIARFVSRDRSIRLPRHVYVLEDNSPNAASS